MIGNSKIAVPNKRMSEVAMPQLYHGYKSHLSKQGHLLKQGVWLYFFLLIFEGTLRKWLLPSLATPLLLIRDPLSIWILFTCFGTDFLKYNAYIFIIFIVTVISFITTLLFGHGNIPVALFGARIFLIQFPMIFAIGKIFTKADVIAMGRWVLYLSIPMIILITIQFYSPQSALVNRGVGGDLAGAGFAGALDYFRPPGTFSFTNGNALFFILTGVFVFYFWLEKQQIKKSVLILASIALILSIPFSISRSLFFSLSFFAIFLIFALVRSSKGVKNLVQIIAILTLVIIIMSKFSFVQNGIEAFTSRFESANEAEGGLKGVFLDRYLGGMISAFSNNSSLAFFGSGLGMGTIVGSTILTGNQTFLIAEGEWGRLTGEMGLILGLSVILIRCFLTIDLLKQAFRKIKNQEYLPWMLVAMVLLILPQGQWAQPTSLGFTVLISGLCMASLKN